MNQTIITRLFNKSQATFNGPASSILLRPRLFAGANALALILPLLASRIAAILMIAQ